MDKIMTVTDWLNNAFFPQDRPSHPCLESTMDNYAAYVATNFANYILKDHLASYACNEQKSTAQLYLDFKNKE